MTLLWTLFYLPLLAQPKKGKQKKKGKERERENQPNKPSRRQWELGKY